MKFNRRHLLLAALATPWLAACSPSAEAPLTPAEIKPDSTCDLDGMLLADFAGPKAQLHYVGQAQPVWTCDTVEMFALLLKPEQQRKLRAVFVQDMGQADWDQPRGHWFDATTGIYVVGGKRRGSMGPTIGSFRQRADAEKFAAEWGGKVLAFAEIKPEMVDLTGGALHDSRM